MSATVAEPAPVAVIGAGYFSRFHMDAWARLPGARLAGVADRDMSAARDRLAEAAPEAAAAVDDDVARLLATTRPAIVDIVTPPPTHLTMIEHAIAAGARMIICQKPFCGDLETARRAAGAAEAAGVALAVHENFRFQPWYRAIKQALDAGAVGRAHQLTFRLRPGDGRGADAYLDRQPYFQRMPRFLVHETGVHWVDTFRFLFGDPVSVYADLRRLNPAIAGEDAGHVLFGFEDARRGVFDGNRLVDHRAENHRRTMGEALIEGDAAVLTLDGWGRVRRRAAGALDETEIAVAAPADGPGAPIGAQFGGDCVYALQAHALAALTRGAPLENAARDYLRVMEIEEAIYRSAETGARVDL